MQSKLQTIEKLFLYFLMAAIIGWCYEVFLEVVVYRWGFQNRGVLFGPYCPVYGVGMLAFLLCFGKFAKMQLSWRVRWARPILIFLGCGAVATLIELAVSYLLEWTTGSWPWQTYADYAINFQARVALSPVCSFWHRRRSVFVFASPAVCQNYRTDVGKGIARSEHHSSSYNGTGFDLYRHF